MASIFSFSFLEKGVNFSFPSFFHFHYLTFFMAVITRGQACCMVLGEEVTNANRVKCKAIVDSYHPPLEVIYTSGEGNRRPFTIGKQVAARDPFTYHCYVDTPPSSPRIVNTVISNDEAINCRQKQNKTMTTTCERNGTHFFIMFCRRL
jgi:hypothetical protein